MKVKGGVALPEGPDNLINRCYEVVIYVYRVNI